MLSVSEKIIIIFINRTAFILKLYALLSRYVYGFKHASRDCADTVTADVSTTHIVVNKDIRCE